MPHSVSSSSSTLEEHLFLSTTILCQGDIPNLPPTLPSLIFGLGGGMSHFFLMIFSLVSVNHIRTISRENVKVGDLSSTDPETRLRRFTTAEAAISAGVILGFLLGGRVTDNLGSLYVFLLCSLLSALGFSYGLVRVRNIVPHVNESENLEEDSGGEGGHWWLRFLSHIKRTLGLPFQKREPGARPLVLLLCLAFLLGVSSDYGIENIDNLLIGGHFPCFPDALINEPLLTKCDIQESPWVWQDILMVLWATHVLHWGADTLLDFKVFKRI